MQIEILDIKIDKRLINQNLLSEKSNLSRPYINLLLHRRRDSKKALIKLRNAIIDLYGSAIEYNSSSKDNNSKPQNKIKKSA